MEDKGSRTGVIIRYQKEDKEKKRKENEKGQGEA